MLRSCRACEREQDPEMVERSFRARQILEDAIAGHYAMDAALNLIRELYEVVPSDEHKMTRS